MSIAVGPGSWLRVRRIYDGRSYGTKSGTLLPRLEGQDIDGMSHPVAPGETLYWEFQLNFKGDSEKNVGIVIKTPPNPNGGFFLKGATQHPYSTSQPYSQDYGYESTFGYGADRFNEPVGCWRCGTPSGEEDGYNTAEGWGILANSDTPGLLQIQVREPMLTTFAEITRGGDITQGDSDSLLVAADTAVTRHPQQIPPDYYILTIGQTFVGGPIPSSASISSPFAWQELVNQTIAESRFMVLGAVMPDGNPKGNGTITITYPSHPNQSNRYAHLMGVWGGTKLVSQQIATGTTSPLSIPFSASDPRNLIVLVMMRETDEPINPSISEQWITPSLVSGPVKDQLRFIRFGPGTLSEDWITGDGGLPSFAIDNRIFGFTMAFYAYQQTSPVSFTWEETSTAWIAASFEFTNRYLP